MNITSNKNTSYFFLILAAIFLLTIWNKSSAMNPDICSHCNLPYKSPYMAAAICQCKRNPVKFGFSSARSQKPAQPDRSGENSQKVIHAVKINNQNHPLVPPAPCHSLLFCDLDDGPVKRSMGAPHETYKPNASPKRVENPVTVPKDVFDKVGAVAVMSGARYHPAPQSSRPVQASFRVKEKARIFKNASSLQTLIMADTKLWSITCLELNSELESKFQHEKKQLSEILTSGDSILITVTVIHHDRNYAVEVGQIFPLCQAYEESAEIGLIMGDCQPLVVTMENIGYILQNMLFSYSSSMSEAADIMIFLHTDLK